MAARGEEHREGGRWATRVDAVIDHQRWVASGAWWEQMEVRATDVGTGGLRLVSPSPLREGARVRLLIPPRIFAEPPLTVEGEIVWVREPRWPIIGMYRAGIRFVPALQRDLDLLLERVGVERSAASAL